MDLTLNILRPDDLLVLQIEAQNLKLDRTNPGNPALIVDNTSSPAYLVVTFQPQTITEKAYFETGTVTQEPPFNTIPPGVTDLPTGGTLPVDPPGQVPTRMGGASRLVFKLPKNVTRLSYQTAALLDWSKLELVVSPLAQGKPLPPPITPPGPLETALEIPYRLILSPGGNVTWVNALSPVAHSGRAELWHTRLAKIVKTAKNNKVTTSFQEAGVGKTIPLRAIWSPDFVDHGPLPSHSQDQTPFLAALSARDRAQLVILTSGSVGYSVENLQGADPWVPQPIQATRLFLSALGGWLSSLGRWSPLPYYVESPKIPIVFPTPIGVTTPIVAKALVAPAVSKSAATKVGVQTAPLREAILFPGVKDVLDLGEWSHFATQGRDHYVRVVYEGFLYPFGHRASLVKVTERKFVPPGAPETPPDPFSVTAYLRQHMYIVVREPDLSYDPATYTHGGREMPFHQGIHLKTVVTPDIDLPNYITSDQNSFWITVGGQNFQFHVTGTDLAGARIDFLAPAIFVSDSENNIGALPPGISAPDSVQGLYRSGGLGPPCAVKGKKVAYADPNAGDTVLKTTDLFFDTQILYSAGPFPSTPFIPILSQAAVSVPSLEELLGVSSPVNIEFYGPYLANPSGLDQHAGVFAQLVGAGPNVEFTADRAGGFATPKLVPTALSARKGVIAGSADDAAQGLIDPAAFFGGFQVEAMLFGTIPLGNLIPLLLNSTKADASKNAPEITTHTEPKGHHPTQVITQVNWVPDLQDYEQDPVRIAFNQFGQHSKLSLNTTLTRMLDGSQGQSKINGELDSFTLTLLGVIGLTIDSIKFKSANGSKTTVVAKLPNKDAIKFIGALSFLQTLADILPPGIFGGQGPSIKLTSTEIKISYTLGLPTISVGVFSLENIAITTGIDLPYLNGQPAFEFAFASRKKPFLITVECLGGGGFVHLVLNTSGIQMVEGALEFGGKFSIDLGVASGGVQIMAGIYFQLKGTDSTVTGFVDISGEVSVLGIISISMDLNLSLSWVHTSSGDKIQGRATLSISVHIIFFSISVSVSVERSFGSGSGDPRVADVIDANDWQEYALAFSS